MVYVVYLLALIFIVLGFLLGLSLGDRFAQEKNAVGNLIIAHGEENEPPYMFLDLVLSTEYLEHNDYVVLKIKKAGTREKQSV